MYGDRCRGGVIHRMGGKDKIMLSLQDEPVIVHTLRALEYCPYIQEIIVVTREELIVPLSKLCARLFLHQGEQSDPGGRPPVRSLFGWASLRRPTRRS